jgi:hypothetical protein
MNDRVRRLIEDYLPIEAIAERDLLEARGKRPPQQRTGTTESGRKGGPPVMVQDIEVSRGVLI